LARFRGIRLPLIVGSALVEALIKDVIKPGDTLAVIDGPDILDFFFGGVAARASDAFLEVAAGERLGDEMRLVLGVQLVAEILDVPLNRPRSNPELLRALLRRQPAGDALQDLAFPLGQGNEIFLLPRKIHHPLRD
jgi:hypothetical protein